MPVTLEKTVTQNIPKIQANTGKVKGQTPGTRGKKPSQTKVEADLGESAGKNL